ncbi:sensor histidine kinase [Deinococcus marmoris]|uniref:histidine kinase n=1 Tax=Deinococcus marmoris TaxID=249408 RepID=A0A1U7NUX3_9DEIO|nr:ATP-binding protein [Deinococcus marmoris]OLV16707.1 Phytochrome, two-component sensor histidine kinase [Deinococcus marmoris]
MREALAAAQRQNEVLSTFVALSEAAATTDDLITLARHVGDVLRRNIPHLLAVYFTRQGERWVADLASDAVPPEFMALVRAGLPLDTPFLAQTVAARTPQFFDHWNPAEQGTPYAEQFQAAGAAPFFEGGRAVALLTVGLVGQAVWTAQQRQLFLAVYQALYSAQQRSVLAQERQRSLEAFMNLTELIGTETEPLQLAQRARDFLQASMPEWSVGYYEWADGWWRALLADVPDPELRASLFAGLPDTTPGYRAAVDAGRPVFFDHWNAAEQEFTHTESYGKAAFAPYFRDGAPVAMFVVGSQHRREWLPEDRAVFETVGRSLGLALERAWQAQALEDRSRRLQASEAQLQRSNRELKAANEDLEAFAYSASHDLRTPVRHVKGFVAMGRRALLDGQLEKAERALNVMEGAADQMNAMIDAMLALSHSSQRPLDHRAVHLDALVDHARANVADEGTGRDIAWQVEGLPQVMGDAATLQQVLTNLLSNAVKFTRTREQAVIEIGTQAGEEAWTVWVRDNGVGFDPAYAGKLFGPFQRLHRHSEFEGTGIGLATVRRIILRHGGRIWANSVPGEGTTFSFTLPHIRPLELDGG